MKPPKIPKSGILRIRKPKPDPKQRAAEASHRGPVIETKPKRKKQAASPVKTPDETPIRPKRPLPGKPFVSGDPRGRPGPGRPKLDPDVKELLKANTVPSILFLAELVSIGREELAEARRRKAELEEFYRADAKRREGQALPMELSRPVTIEVDVRAAIRAAEILLDRALGKPKQDVSIEGLEGVTITIAPPEDIQ